MGAKIFILVVMVAILYCLGSGIYYLLKDGGRTSRTARALTWRIALSMSLFVLLFVAFALGYIQPHGLR